LPAISNGCWLVCAHLSRYPFTKFESMSAYLLCADTYATLVTIFTSEFDALDLDRLFSKYKGDFAQFEPLDPNLYGTTPIVQFLTAKMVNANSLNLHQLYSDRCAANEIILNTEQAKRFVDSGSPNQKWLKVAQSNKQLIIQEIDWWQSHTCDYESDSPIYRLLDEAISKYAV
jgi:hypothetical protein